MTKRIVMFFLTMLTGVDAYCESLADISIFAGKICDEIVASGSITRTKIEASITGQANTIAKLIGAKIGADGRISIDNTKYDGFPYNELSEQIKDARACKKEIAYMLVEKREFISEVKSQSGSAAEYMVASKGFEVFLMREPVFKKFIDLPNEYQLAHLPDNTMLILGEAHVEPKENNNGLSLPLSWRRVKVVSGEHSGKQGWVPQTNIAQK